MRNFGRGVRHPMDWLREICGGEAAFPLIVLFGLNAVDELDRTAFGILLPEIRDSFGIDIQTALSIVALSSVAALALQVPIAQYADKTNRIPLVVFGALAWGFFSGMTGLATGLILLTIARSGSSLGKAVIDPTHNSLIADYYPIETRSRVYSFHRAANAVGAFIGPLSAGLLAYYFDWRVPFLVFVVPTVIFALLATRLHEPTRGRWERHATGASQEIIDTEEESPSFAESWRTADKVKSLQRIWWSLPFLATSLIGFVTLAALLYEQKFDLDERARGVAAAVSEPFALVGLVIGARIATRRFVGNVKGLIRFVASIAVVASIASAGFALAPNVYVAVALNCVISASLAIIGPGVLAALLARHSSPRPSHRLRHRIAVGDPRSGDPADDRLDRRQLEHRGRDAHDDPDVPDRQPDAAQRGRRDRRRHRPGLAVGRSAPAGGAVRASTGHHQPAAPARRRSRLRQPHRAARHRPASRRGRGGRVARHERCGQVDAAEVDQRHRRGRPGRDRCSTAATSPTLPRTRSLHSASSRCPAVRACSAPSPSGRTSSWPAGRTGATAKGSPSRPPKYSRRSRFSPIGSTPPLRTCPAASSRCWRLR